MNKPALTAALALAVALTLTACEEKSGNMLKDPRDGKKYRTVKIGEQVWMAENLNYKTSNSWCYDDDESNCDKYGRLYDWETAKVACPSGWHLPFRGEWGALAIAAGGIGKYGGDSSTAGTKLKSKSGWSDYDGKNGNGTDEFGFSALPGGLRFADDNSFALVGYDGSWWTATDASQERNGDVYRRSMTSVSAYYERVEESPYGNKGNGYSVRCVQGAVEEASVADAKIREAEAAKREAETCPNIRKIPAGYQLYIPDGSIVGDIPGEVHGDLNGDGLEDCVLLIRSTDQSNIDNDDPHAPDKNPLGIMIFFNTGNGYRLVFENRDGIPPPEYDSQMMHDYSVEIKNGKLYISERGRYGGEKYTFRYKNSEFELIGFDSYSEKFVSHITEKEVSINFLTKKRLTKVNVSEDDENEDKAVFKETWDVIKMDNPPKLLKSGDFVKMNVD
jgi:uncharacterized protein (TIGR02145 family)